MAEDRDLGLVWGEFERRCDRLRAELTETRVEISALEVRREATRERLRRAMISFAYGVQLTADVLLQNRLIRQIYWHDQDIPTVWIAEAFGLSEYEVVHIAGRLEPVLTCRGCGNPLAVAGRDELKRLQREQRKRDRVEEQGPLGGLLCRSCWKAHGEELDAAREQSRKAHSAHLAGLKSLPYAEYVKAPEWMARRKRHLEEVDNRCQVCGSAGNRPRLSVRHRSRKNLGEEPWDDLIALCESCDVLFQERLRGGQR